MTDERRAEGPWNDPIVEEVRRVRRDFSARFNHDLTAMFEYLRERQEESRKQGRVIISAPLRRTSDSSDPAA